MENLPSDVEHAYQTLAAAPKYKHFVRIPDRIIQCIDYFGIECDRVTTRERLQAYYLFIGVVDDAIDERNVVARHVVVARAPALFVLPCGDPDCRGGGHDMTESLMRKLREGALEFVVEHECGGDVRGALCDRLVRIRGAPSYSDV